MAAEPPGFHLEGRAELALVDRALDELELLWTRTPDVPAEDRILFGLALSEVMTNVSQHSSGVEVTMSVDVRASRDALRAEITDSAAPATIDWDGVAMPDQESESGRGLALAVAALDQFDHANDRGGNTWVLVRRLRAQGTDPSV